MKSKTLYILLGIFFVLLGGWLYLKWGGERPAAHNIDWGMNLLTRETVDGITITEGKEHIQLSRQSSGIWFVNGANADEDAIKRFWDQWKTVAIQGPVSTNKNNHQAFMVDDALGRSVVFRTDQKELLHVIIGSLSPTSDGSYVRRASEDAVYTVMPSLTTLFSLNAEDWKPKSKQETTKEGKKNK